MDVPFNPAIHSSEIPIAYWRRYLRLIYKYGSIKKFINLTYAYLHWIKGSSRIPTLPAFLKVEMSRHCLVNCKYCYPKKDKVFYPLNNYKNLIDDLKEHIFFVSLYDIGEPLEHPDLIEAIKYAHNNRIGTVISSSLSLKKTEKFWEELILSGIDRIIVGIDGISKKTYNKYRTNADLDLVFDNLKKAIHYKNLHRKNIIIEWQMIDLPWNTEEVQSSKEKCKELGCDLFRLIPEATRPRLDYENDNYVREKNCLLPYLVLIVDAYSNVRPCYKIYNNSMSVGHLDPNNIKQIWNGDNLSWIRNKYKIKNRAGCRTCRE